VFNQAPFFAIEPVRGQAPERLREADLAIRAWPPEFLTTQ
jgi:hypothetical protein